MNPTTKFCMPDAGHPLLQRLLESIEVIDGRVCWDFYAMYDLRDALATPQAPPVDDPQRWLA